MQIDLAYTGPILGVERAADKALASGYTGLWASETKHDPFLTLALATRACPQLEIGTGVAVALARSPYTIAQSAWDLAAVSQAQFRLGIGSQVKAHITRRFSMPWSHPVAQMKDMIAAIRAIWHSFESGEKLDYRGPYYQHTLLTPNFNPGPTGQTSIPIGLAAVGPKMTELAAEVANFVILHPFTHVDFLDSITRPALHRGLQRADRSRQDLEVVGSVFAFAEGAEAAQYDAVIRQKIAFYGSTPSYFKVFETLGREDLGPKLHGLSKEGRWLEMSELIDDRVLDSFRIRAPQDQLFDQVRKRFSGRYDRAILTVPGR